MKNFCTITIFFLLSSLCLFAQDSLLNYFATTLTQQNEVYLNWEIKGGYTCNGINIYHSTDGTQYQLIGDIQGICGSLSTAERYSFTHNNPLVNSINYYKIELGFNGHTAYSSIHVYALNQWGYTLFPNPSNGIFNFYFKNNLNENIALILFDINGKNVCLLNTTDNYMIINLEDLPKGLYYYKIISNSLSAGGILMLN